MQKVFAFIVAVLVTYVIAVAFVSQFNIAQIVALGQPVDFSHRAATMLHDVAGMVSLYLLLIAIGLLVAWLFTGLVLSKWLPSTVTLYALAGFVGLIVLHQTLYMAFGMNPIAAVRTLPGLLSQGFAGAIGGYLFYRIAFSAKS